jgi:hypothetical protein
VTAPAATACDLQLPHDVTAACPLRCLHLPARASTALRHHLHDPRATVTDLITLSRNGELDGVRNVGPRTASQIRTTLARCAGLIPAEKEHRNMTVRAALARHAGLTPAHKEHPHMTAPAHAPGRDDDPARYLLASHPLLRWDAIAAHAHDHHGITWPGDDAARTAITGAFDAITPYHCGYDPADGTITSPPLPAPPAWAPGWSDPEMLNCTIATIAASTARCDLLQETDDEITPDTDPC